MHPVLFKIGTIKIYSYGVFVFGGVVAGYLVFSYFLKKERFDKKIIQDLFFYMIIGGFVGARILYILINLDYFFASPLKTLFGRSGFVFYGGILGGILSLFLYSSKNRLCVWKVLDVCSVSILIGHSIGRIGCFMNGCCFGIPNPRWGIEFSPQSFAGMFYPHQKIIPTQLISSISLFIFFLIFIYLYRHRKFEGQIFCLYLVVYGVFRFLIEFLRGDPRPFIGGLSLFQWMSLGLILAGTSLYILKSFKK